MIIIIIMMIIIITTFMLDIMIIMVTLWSSSVKRVPHRVWVVEGQTDIIIMIITSPSDIIIMDVIIMTIIIMDVIIMTIITMVTLWSSNVKRVPHRGWEVGGQTDIIIMIITSPSDIIIMDVIIMTIIIMDVIIMTIITMVTLWSSNVKRVPHRGWEVGGQTDRSGTLDCTARSIKLPA